MLKQLQSLAGGSLPPRAMAVQLVSAGSTCFGVSLDKLEQATHQPVPALVLSCCAFIKAHLVVDSNPLEHDSKKTRFAKLRAHCEAHRGDGTLPCDATADDAAYLLRVYLAALPLPLMHKDATASALSLWEPILCVEKAQASSFAADAAAQLPRTSRAVLAAVVDLMRCVASNVVRRKGTNSTAKAMEWVLANPATAQQGHAVRKAIKALIAGAQAPPPLCELSEEEAHLAQLPPDVLVVKLRIALKQIRELKEQVAMLQEQLALATDKPRDARTSRSESTCTDFDPAAAVSPCTSPLLARSPSPSATSAEDAAAPAVTPPPTLPQAALLPIPVLHPLPTLGSSTGSTPPAAAAMPSSASASSLAAATAGAAAKECLSATTTPPTPTATVSVLSVPYDSTSTSPSLVQITDTASPSSPTTITTTTTMSSFVAPPSTPQQPRKPSSLQPARRSAPVLKQGQPRSVLMRSVSLYVLLVGAQNLYPANKSGSCDAFVVLTVGHSRQKSHVAKRTLNPEWRAQFVFDTVNMEDFLTAKVYQSATIGAPKLLGCLDLPLCAVGDGLAHDDLYPLETTADMRGAASGALRLVTQCAVRGSDVVLCAEERPRNAPPLVHFGSGRIAVELLEIAGVAHEHEALPKCCSMHVGAQRARTEPTALLREPWKHQVFYFEGDEHAVLELRLKECAQLRKSVLVGVGALSVSTLVPGSYNVLMVPLYMPDPTAPAPSTPPQPPSSSSSSSLPSLSPSQQPQQAPQTLAAPPPALPAAAAAGSMRPTGASLKVCVAYTPAVAIAPSEVAHSSLVMNCDDALFDPVPPPKEAWVASPCRAQCALVAVESALAHGYHVEDSRAAVTCHSTVQAGGQATAADDVFDETSTFPFFARFFYGAPYRLYVSEAPPAGAAAAAPGGRCDMGHVLVTVAPSEWSDMQLRVIVWTKYGTKRLVVPNIAGHLRVLQAIHAPISACQFRDCTACRCQDELLEYERLRLRKKYKVGVCYCAAGQHSEAQFLNNQGASPAFQRFLERLGQRVVLRGWQYFKGGLDSTKDLDGAYSYYTTYKDIEVMFHVCTMLPHSSTDTQQVNRKRHLGNDAVIVIFKERGPAAADGQQDVVDVTTVRSQWNHVFIVVSPETCESAGTARNCYRVNVVYKANVEPAAPYVPESSLLPDDDKLHDWVLRKIINAERNAVESPLFKLGQQRAADGHLAAIVEKCRAQQQAGAQQGAHGQVATTITTAAAAPTATTTTATTTTGEKLL